MSQKQQMIRDVQSLAAQTNSRFLLDVAVDLDSSNRAFMETSKDLDIALTEIERLKAELEAKNNHTMNRLTDVFGDSADVAGELQVTADLIESEYGVFDYSYPLREAADHIESLYAEALKMQAENERLIAINAELADLAGSTVSMLQGGGWLALADEIKEAIAKVDAPKGYARLIAAAPDLLSALKAMIDEHEPLTSSACDLQNKVRALIDKVEDDQS